MSDEPRLNSWLEKPFSQAVVDVEGDRLRRVLPDLHGHYMLQYSGWGKRVISATTLRYLFSVSEGMGLPDAVVDYETMPFRENSLDCVLLHHVLEYTENPHQVLREAARMVVPNGYLMIVGFNPYSLWNVSRFMPRGHVSTDGRFISKSRVADWLALLGFRVEQIEVLHALPPFWLKWFPKSYARWNRKLLNIGWRMGGSYVVVARKLVAGRTLVRPQWRVLTGRRLPPVATPSARGMRVSDR